MKIARVAEVLKTLGWEGSSCDGDRIAKYQLSDRIVRLVYKVTRLPDQQRLVIVPSVLDASFSNACAKVGDLDGQRILFVRSWNFPGLNAPEILEKHVRQASASAIAWAKEQDLEKALHERTELPTNSPGTFPVQHFAALALTGDVDRLKSYLESFDAGDRLGFVPYITRDYIVRALELAGAQARSKVLFFSCRCS